MGFTRQTQTPHLKLKFGYTFSTEPMGPCHVEDLVWFIVGSGGTVSCLHLGSYVADFIADCQIDFGPVDH